MDVHSFTVDVLEHDLYELDSVEGAPKAEVVVYLTDSGLTDCVSIFWL